MLGPRVGGDGAALGSRCGETLKLNIWRRKARWPNGSLETLEMLEGGVAVRRCRELLFLGRSPPLQRVALLVTLYMHFVGQGELSDPTHHWVLVTTHKKVGGAFCGVPHNQVGLWDGHQSNPLMDT